MRLAIAHARWIAMLAASLGAVSHPAHARLSGSVSLVSDYDYRGVTQSANEPALQLEADYVLKTLHIEVWSSNVNYDRTSGFFDSRHTEVAYSADLTAAEGHWLSYNLGMNYATYPGWHPGFNYAEAWGSVIRGPVSGSIHYAWDYSNRQPRAAAYYAEVNGTFPVLDDAFDVVAHLGTSWGPYWTQSNDRAYQDYALGIEKAWGRMIFLIEGIATHRYESTPRGQPFSGTPKLWAGASIAMF